MPPGKPLALALLLVAASALPARAELVVLSDGRFFKVRSYEIDGERMRMELAEGGFLTMSMSRVERVVADEVPLPAEEAAEPPIEAPPEPEFSWRLEADHGIPATPYGELIFQVASRHQVNPALVAAVVRAESAFRAGAISHKGACGLMQLMPATAWRFGLHGRAIFDPAKNLDAGTEYLRFLLERFHSDLTLALAAYNAGEGTVDRFGGIPPFRETRGYVRRILGYLGLEGADAEPEPELLAAGAAAR
ncbi:MAG: lytic transglycosylase domain-containing protein [Thermoanaerobaculia bacterium]